MGHPEENRRRMPPNIKNQIVKGNERKTARKLKIDYYLSGYTTVGRARIFKYENAMMSVMGRIVEIISAESSMAEHLDLPKTQNPNVGEEAVFQSTVDTVLGNLR